MEESTPTPAPPAPEMSPLERITEELKRAREELAAAKAAQADAEKALLNLLDGRPSGTDNSNHLPGVSGTGRRNAKIRW